MNGLANFSDVATYIIYSTVCVTFISIAIAILNIFS